MASARPRDLTPARATPQNPAAGRLSETWRKSAACRQADPELFFPIGQSGPAAVEIQHAKAVCALCPVRQPCLVYALTTRQQYGIWGGCDENERRLLHRQRPEPHIAAGQEHPQPQTRVPHPLPRPAARS